MLCCRGAVSVSGLATLHTSPQQGLGYDAESSPGPGNDSQQSLGLVAENENLRQELHAACVEKMLKT